MAMRAEAGAPRVLLVTSFRIPHVGGASTHVELLAAALERRGMLHALAVPPPGAHRRDARYLLWRAVRPDRAATTSLEATCERLRRTIEKASSPQPPAVIHAHDPLATCAALRARPAGAAVVQTVHGPWSREAETMHRRPWPRAQETMRAMEREAFAAADLVLAVDRGQADLVARDFGVDPRRIVVIPNAVDVDALPAAAASPVPGPFLLVPRRLVPKNGVELAIRAVALARADTPPLVVAGDGPLRSELQALARRLGVGPRVVFLGDVEHARLLRILSGATAVLVPSVPVNGVVEATSLSVLEAMASRVPVIGSRIGGIAEIMAGGCGVLVPPGDAEALAAAVAEVVEMPPRVRAALVEQARARVRTAYGVESWMERIAGAYALARRRSPVLEVCP